MPVKVAMSANLEGYDRKGELEAVETALMSNPLRRSVRIESDYEPYLEVGPILRIGNKRRIVRGPGIERAYYALDDHRDLENAIIELKKGISDNLKEMQGDSPDFSSPYSVRVRNSVWRFKLKEFEDKIIDGINRWFDESEN